MKTENRIAYLSALQQRLDDMEASVDQKICDADDGEPDTVKDAKALVICEILDCIRQLNLLKQDIETMTVKKFHEEYLS